MKTIDANAMSRFGCSNMKSNNRCNNRPKEIQCDVPCINITLRSDCKLHSNQYNYVQKEDAQNEHKSVPQSREYLTRTNMSELDLSNKKNHSICFNADNHFNVLQTVRMKYEAKLGRPDTQQFSSLNNHTAFDVTNNLDVSQLGGRSGTQYNQDIEQSTFTSTPQIAYGRQSFLRYPFHSTKIWNDTTDSKPISSEINSTVLEKADQKDKLETNFDVDTFDVKSNLKSSKKVSWKDLSQIMLQNDKKKDLVNLEKFDTGKQNFSYVPRENNKSLLQNLMTFRNTDLNSKSINAFVNSKFQRIENSLRSTDYKYSICTNRIPYITKNLIDNDKIENSVCTNRVCNISENNYGKHISLEERTCNQITEKKHKKTCTDIKCTNDVTTNTLVKFANTDCCNEENKEKCCMKTIDIALDTLQDMSNKIKKLQDKSSIKQYSQDCHYQEVRCKNMDCNYSNGRYEVALLECKHNSVKPSELMTPDCMKMLQEIKEYTKILEEQLTIIDKNIKIKKKTIEKLVPTVEYTMDLKYNQDIYNTRQQKDTITQNPEKRNICIQEPSKDYVNCAQYTIEQIEEKNKYQKEEKQGSKNCKMENCNVNVDDQIKRQDDTKTTQHVKVQCVRSFHIIDPLNCRPISACICNEGVNVSDNKSDGCVQNCIAGKNLTQRMDKTMIDKLILDSIKVKNVRTNLMNVSDEQESLTCEEKAIMMLLLAKSISNKCLKSKYKKSELINFRPKCITNSCISCHQRLVKCKSKRKMQIPVVFKQSKPTKCRIEENIYSNQNRHEYFPKQLENENQLTNSMTVCTQSSNLHITTATSVSRISISTKSRVDNVTEEKRPRGDACILS
nr:PREDICTED: uncharacterized protein LOC105662483 [Megachile rotundata]